MVYLATDTFGHGAAVSSDSGDDTVSVPGLVAAGAWALGLMVGLVALATGHQLIAGVALILAIMSPWFGLAWVSRGQRREAHARLITGREVASYAGGWPAR